MKLTRLIQLNTLPLIFCAVGLNSCGPSLQHDPSDLLPLRAQAKLESVWSGFIDANDSRHFKIFAPTIVGDDLYLTTQNGSLYKFQLEDQTPNLSWLIRLGASINASPTVHNQKIFLCVGDRQLRVHDANNGDLVRVIEIEDQCVAPPVVTDQAVYLRLRNDTVIAHDLQNKHLWQFSQKAVGLSLEGDSPLLLHEGALFYGSNGSRLFSLTPENGQLHWSTLVGIPSNYTEIGLILDIDAPLTVWRDYVIASAWQGRILMVNALTGREIWGLDISTRSGILIDSDADRGWVVDGESVMRGINLRSGEEVWQTGEMKYRSLSKPVRSGELLISADRFGYLHYFNPHSGDYLGNYRAKVERTRRDSREKRHLRGRPLPPNSHTQLFEAWGDLFILRDLSGRLIFYRVLEKSI